MEAVMLINILCQTFIGITIKATKIQLIKTSCCDPKHILSKHAWRAPKKVSEKTPEGWQAKTDYMDFCSLNQTCVSMGDGQPGRLAFSGFAAIIYQAPRKRRSDTPRKNGISIDAKYYQEKL
ncbi:hypothetical protein CEXT_10291 [Caerostris extrusa]|uniref:Uncharacterized protein n=1 Tax=Caerostris extrusa TaxID=172846 RepID=A0AAV4NHP3_CAEEX|nr:hypothetical protein CEXT_10291 [Caerostris extrusa]